MWYRNKLAELTEGIRPLINGNEQKWGSRGERRGIGRVPAPQNKVWLFLPSLNARLFSGKPAKCWCYILSQRLSLFCPSRQPQYQRRQRIKLKRGETKRTEGFLHEQKQHLNLHALLIKEHLSHLKRQKVPPGKGQMEGRDVRLSKPAKMNLRLFYAGHTSHAGPSMSNLSNVS